MCKWYHWIEFSLLNIWVSHFYFSEQHFICYQILKLAAFLWLFIFPGTIVCAAKCTREPAPGPLPMGPTATLASQQQGRAPLPGSTRSTASAARARPVQGRRRRSSGSTRELSTERGRKGRRRGALAAHLEDARMLGEGGGRSKLSVMSAAELGMPREIGRAHV